MRSMRFLLFALGLSGCALFTRETAKDVLSVVQIACIIAHQEMPDSDVTKVCAITEPFIDPMRRVLLEARHASAKAAERAGCRP